MLPLGHLAAALLASDAVRGDALAAALGSQLPDLVDKPLAWVFRATKSSRFLAHNLPALGLASLAAYGLGGRQRALGLAAGYATHLCADQLLGGRVPLFWPFKRYKLSHKSFGPRPLPLLIEVIAAAYLWRRLRRKL